MYLELYGHDSHAWVVCPISRSFFVNHDPVFIRWKTLPSPVLTLSAVDDVFYLLLTDFKHLNNVEYIQYVALSPKLFTAYL